MNSHLDDWLSDTEFQADVSTQFDAWYRNDAFPPTALASGDWQRTPAQNWPIEMLVTWMALNAYRAYDRVYGHFRAGYRFDAASARDLTSKAIALTLLVLGRASGYAGPIVPAGPRIAATPFGHNFGWIPPGATRSFTFQVHSDGTAPLDVASVAMFGARSPLSAGPFRLTAVQPPAPATLAVGQGMKITVSYTAPRLEGAATPADRRPTGSGPKARPGILGIASANAPSLNPSFRSYAGVVIVRSNAANAPGLTLHVRGGGLPLPWILDRERAEVQRAPEARDVRARSRAADAVKELEELGKMWR